MDKRVEIQKTNLDGRAAERHTCFNDDGDKIVEIFAEEERPLKLEKRIIQKHKNVIAEERTEYIKDGEIIEVEVKSINPPVQMQLREHIGVADHSKLFSGEYVTKQELGPVVSEAVVTGIAQLLDNIEINQQSVKEEVTAPMAETPIFTAQQQIAERVGIKADNDLTLNMIFALLIIAQLGFGFWVFFM